MTRAAAFTCLSSCSLFVACHDFSHMDLTSCTHVRYSYDIHLPLICDCADLSIYCHTTITVLGFKELYVCSSVDCARLISHFDKELRIFPEPREAISVCSSWESEEHTLWPVRATQRAV